MMRVFRDDSDDPAGVDLLTRVDSVTYYRRGTFGVWERSEGRDPLWACEGVAMAQERMALGWPTVVTAHDAVAVDAWLAARGEAVEAYQGEQVAQVAQEVTA